VNNRSLNCISLCNFVCIYSIYDNKTTFDFDLTLWTLRLGLVDKFVEVALVARPGHLQVFVFIMSSISFFLFLKIILDRYLIVGMS
jgi:hypothetical protein